MFGIPSRKLRLRRRSCKTRSMQGRKGVQRRGELLALRGRELMGCRGGRAQFREHRHHRGGSLAHPRLERRIGIDSIVPERLRAAPDGGRRRTRDARRRLAERREQNQRDQAQRFATAIVILNPSGSVREMSRTPQG